MLIVFHQKNYPCLDLLLFYSSLKPSLCFSSSFLLSARTETENQAVQTEEELILTSWFVTLSTEIKVFLYSLKHTLQYYK